MDDRELIALYFARDERALDETAAKYGGLCLSVAERLLGSREDAEECVNDAYLSVWNAIPPARPASLMAWLCKVTRNLSLKRLERAGAAKRTAVLVPLAELEELLPASAAAPSPESGELARLLEAFLRQEKADARRVFLRRYFFFDSVSEIAARYSFSESRVKSMLHRTRARLREYLRKEGYEL